MPEPTTQTQADEDVVDKTASDSLEETEKTDLEKEFDEDEDEVEMTCCRDMVQTVVNVVFFLVVGFPICKSSVALL